MKSEGRTKLAQRIRPTAVQTRELKLSLWNKNRAEVSQSEKEANSKYAQQGRRSEDPEQAGTQHNAGLPRCRGAFLQGGGRVGSIGQGALWGHDQREGDTGFAGALAVWVGHRHGTDTAAWKKK